jgi:hypothetical protein
MLWGTEAHLRELLGDGIAAFAAQKRTFTFRFRSAEEFAEFFRLWYGPTLKAFAALDGDAHLALERDLVQLARRSNRLETGAVAIPATYLEAIAIKR